MKVACLKIVPSVSSNFFKKSILETLWVPCLYWSDFSPYSLILVPERNKFGIYLSRSGVTWGLECQPECFEFIYIIHESLELHSKSSTVPSHIIILYSKNVLYDFGIWGIPKHLPGAQASKRMPRLWLIELLSSQWGQWQNFTVIWLVNFWI